MMTFRREILLPLTIAITIATSLPAAGQPSSDAPAEGTPITSPVVRRACGECHQSDAEGRMTRISYQRTTPEGWQQTIRRMVLLNDLEIEPSDAQAVVRYLADRHGLAPEEARPAAFEVERRMIDYFYAADPETQTTCNRCHSLGRVITQRRTKEEWQLLTAMHLGYYPFADFQSFYRFGPATDDDPRQPVERAIDHLAAAFPLDTPEWTAWSANMRPPRLAGSWALVGHHIGKGPIYGQVTITASSDAPDAFQTDARYVYARTGESVSRTGEALVYTGFQWRGRSTSADIGPLREVMFVERDWQEMSGRWFTGDYDEIGIDVTLRRVDTAPLMTGVHPPSIRRSASATSLTLYGVNLANDLSPADIDLGPDLEVTDIVETSSSRAVVRVAVTPDAEVGTRDLFLNGSFLRNAVAVYDELHRLDVTPNTGMARVGGVVFPKQYEQFEARGYHNGADGEPNTADDLDLGVMDVEWSLEEYAAILGDDDLEFVGELDQAGLFTPALDGPNPSRVNNANNVGDLWVVATVPESTTSQSIRGRGHLLVTVPLYIRRGGSTEIP